VLFLLICPPPPLKKTQNFSFSSFGFEWFEKWRGRYYTTSRLQGALQHTATHCNILQHTATYCNTLQHTATHCNMLQHTATYCNTRSVLWSVCNTLHPPCNILQHTATQKCLVAGRARGGSQKSPARQNTVFIRLIYICRCVCACVRVYVCVCVCTYTYK